MYEEELKWLWERMKARGEKFYSALKNFQYTLNGVIIIVGEEEGLVELKKELKKVEIQISDYETYGGSANRYIKILPIKNKRKNI